MEAILLFLVLFYFSEISVAQQNEIQCPPLPFVEIPNGKFQVLIGKRIHFTCDPGFHLLGPTILRCHEGNWSSNIIPKCRRSVRSCDPPDPISNGEIWGSDWNIGDEIFYVCNTGYRLLGDRVRKCLRSRYWDGIEPICQDENEPLKKIADRMKKQFITKVSDFSSESTSRAIGVEIRKIGLEMIFLIDRSSSVDPVDFKMGIEFIKFLIDEFGARNEIDNEVGTRVAFITFGDEAEVVINVNDEKLKDKQDAKNILDSLQPEGGGTAMTNALGLIPGKIVPVLRRKAKKVIFLLTDGYNNVGKTPPEDIATILKGHLDFEIFTVGVGRDINKEELVKIATLPQSNHVFLLNKYSDLKDILWLIRNNEVEEHHPEKPSSCGYLAEAKNNKRPETIPNWPWLATIYVVFPSDSEVPKLGICSGSLICSRWVLTSASCFYGEDENIKIRSTKNVFVTMGEKNLSLREKTERNFYAVNVRLHPKYDRTKPGDNDLALLKLNEHVPLDDVYKTICLPKFDLFFDESERGYIIGWGNKPSEKFFGKHFASSFNILPSEGYLPIAREFECSRVKMKITNNLFCVGSIVNRTCAGNLGSPLVIRNEKTKIHYLKGVLIERKWCHNQFNVFIHVENYVKWINNVTNSCQVVS